MTNPLLIAAGAGLGTYLLTRKKEPEAPAASDGPEAPDGATVVSEEAQEVIAQIQLVTRKDLSPETINLMTMWNSTPEGKAIQADMFTLDSFFVELNFAMANNKEWAIGTPDVRFEPKTMDLYFGINTSFYDGSKNLKHEEPLKFHCEMPKDDSFPNPWRTNYGLDDIGNTSGKYIQKIVSFWLTPANLEKVKSTANHGPGALLPETWLGNVVFLATISAANEQAVGYSYANYGCFVCPAMKQFQVKLFSEYKRYSDDLDGWCAGSTLNVTYGMPMLYNTNGIWSTALSDVSDVLDYVNKIQESSEFARKLNKKNGGFPINTVLMTVAATAATIGSVYGIVPPSVTAQMWKSSITGIANLAKGGSDYSMRQMMSVSLDAAGSVMKANGKDILGSLGDSAADVLPGDLTAQAEQLFSGGVTLADSFRRLSVADQGELAKFMAGYMTDEKFNMAKRLGLTGDLSALKAAPQVYTYGVEAIGKITAAAGILGFTPDAETVRQTEAAAAEAAAKAARAAKAAAKAAAAK